ncbi:hypothetical protein QQ008_07225 [Fulvivirgaceae bacterium BMA10]|uniref:Dihydrodipicolinate reductase n=1 Tax=Splendidivirga corallicola TaxID=3051826 RepID=A0ABT8KKA9_9BACT|nr:hypothetical protein [Fulvivirgaceae bacterium BMA10]
MKNIKIIQVGMGPLGTKIAEFIKNREGLTTVAAIDKNPDLVGKSLKELNEVLSDDIKISDDLVEAVQHRKPDVAVLTTVSDMERITAQVQEIVSLGIPVVSTCEELSYPWNNACHLAQQIDESAKSNKVAVVGTGVNPGFLMDSLPTFLTSVCQNVKSILVNRYQDAQYRRLPFQKKIGAGLTLEEFNKRKQEGSLRHVGLTESMQLIANRLGWELDNTEDIIDPVIAENEIVTPAMIIPKGNATGVKQVGKAYINGEAKITLVFQASVSETESFDEILIKGDPEIRSKIIGGVNGDIATCAITINTISQVLNARPGLRTMADIPLVSYYENRN